MQTILGSNGVIGKNLAKSLVNHTSEIRLVGRNPLKVVGNEQLVQADLTDWKQCREAIRGSEVAYLTVGLNYSYETWNTEWPKIMNHTIQACEEFGTKLVFFDNVYCYGRTNSPMTEESPFNPCSKKGEVRARIAGKLLEEIKSGNIKAQIARSADFYGPHASTSFLGMLVFDKMAKGKAAQWMIDENKKHSFTHVVDAANACAILGNTEKAYGETWHLPTYSETLTGKEMIELIAIAFSCAPNYSVYKKWMMQLVSPFNPIVKETIEMLYQMEDDYVFRSDKFDASFGKMATSYKQGVVDTVRTYTK